MRRRSKEQRNPRTPLLGLVSSGWNDENHVICHQIFKLLIKFGADLEAKDGAGETALLNLSTERTLPSRKAVASLLEAGANISAAVDRNGDTILHRFAKENRDIEFLELLFEHGCSVEDRGSGGQTVLQAALSPFMSPTV